MSEAEVRRLLTLCEAADDQDTGSLDAFREAASVGVVAALCREVLAQGEALRQVVTDIDAVPEYQLNPRTEDEVRAAAGGEGETCSNCDHGTDPKTLTTCNECEGTGVAAGGEGE